MEAAADASPLEASPRAGSWRRTTSRPWSRSSSIGRSGGGGGSSGGSGSIEYTSLRDVLEDEEADCCGGAGAGGGECGAEHNQHHHHHHQHQNQQQWRWGSSWGEHSCHDIHDFDASNIGIRNTLLKHAASAYLQSAVLVAAGGRDDGQGGCCLARLWRRAGFASSGAGRRGGRGGGHGRVLMRACSWQGCVDDPAAVVAGTVRRLAAFVADRVSAIWAW